MTKIVLQPTEVRSRANQIKKNAADVLNAINAVDKEVRSLGPEVYEGVSADRFRKDYGQVRKQLQSFNELLNAFAKEMTQIANDLETVDKKRG
jgi:WXG100 family type VII secretion target